MTPTYLDWAATAKPFRDIAVSAADLSIDAFGNPASRHGAGRAASEALESSRKRLAASLACPAECVYFTSGGSESDAIVLLSCLLRPAERSIVISAIEHAAVHEQAKALEGLGVRVLRVAPRRDGCCDPAEIASAIRPDTVLVSVMAVNNETGAIQDIKAIAAAAREASRGRPLLVHSDAVQAFGKIHLRADELGLDAMSMSAHKLGGPRGIGSLFLRKPIQALVRGGGQENGIRPGTCNVAGAWAFSMAAERAAGRLRQEWDRVRMLESRLIDGSRAIGGCAVLPEGRMAGDPRYSPYIVPLAFPGLGAETLVRALDDEGILVSAGAACSGASKERRVYDAMRTPPDLSFSAVRVSFGRDSAAEDVDRFLETASKLYARYRA